jgi:hypothetical protein
LYRPPFCIPALLFAGSAALPFIRRRFLLSELWTRTYPVALVQCFLYLSTLATGAIWTVNWEHPGGGPNYWALRAVGLAFLSSVALSIYWIAKMKGLRWFAFSVSALQIWLLLGANYIASMGILGKD